MKYLHLVWVVIVLAVAITFLSAVYKEAQSFGVISWNPEGEAIGILNSRNYPVWFHLGIGISIFAIIGSGIFVYRKFFKK